MIGAALGAVLGAGVAGLLAGVTGVVVAADAAKNGGDTPAARVWPVVMLGAIATGAVSGGWGGYKLGGG